MTRRIDVYISDIVEHMDKAEAFIDGLDEGAFQSDEKTRFAVVRCLEVIGEAAKHIPDSVRTAYPAIPWRDMAGMRDKIAHFYFGTDFKKVWLVVREDVPRLKPVLKTILEAVRGQE